MNEVTSEDSLVDQLIELMSLEPIQTSNGRIPADLPTIARTVDLARTWLNAGNEHHIKDPKQRERLQKVVDATAAFIRSGTGQALMHIFNGGVPDHVDLGNAPRVFKNTPRDER